MLTTVSFISNQLGDDQPVTHRFGIFCAIFEVLSVGNIVDHIGKPGSEVRVTESSIFQLQLKACIYANKKCIFPSLQHG
jgi:hypothetical protein